MRSPTPFSALAGAVVLAAGLMSSCAGTSGSQVAVHAPTTVAESTTTTRPPDCAELLPTSAKAGQMVMVMVTAPNLAEAALTGGTAGGFGLKGRQSADVGTEVSVAVADAPILPFVASDEEGGTVQRLSRALSKLPAASSMGEGTVEEAATLMGDYAEQMVALGFNMNFGPVADVGSGSGLGTRSFSDEVDTTSSFVDAIVTAQQEAGIISVVKHWPGIGGGDKDPHVALDSLDPIDQLRSADLTVFESAFAAGAPAVMVSHSVIPGLTGDNEPATLSRAAITDELRGRQGFEGLVLTDSLGMGAVISTTPQADAAERAIAAGADIALISGTDDLPAVHEQLVEAIDEERIDPSQVDASVRRILALKGVDGQCLDLVAAFSKLADTAEKSPSTTTATSGSTGTGSDTAGGSSGGSTTTGSGSGNSGSGSSGSGSGNSGSGSSGSGSGSGNSGSSSGSSGTSGSSTSTTGRPSSTSVLDDDINSAG